MTLPILRSVGEGLTGTDPTPAERELGREGDGREEGKGGGTC